jgi:WD40 repeat protein
VIGKRLISVSDDNNLKVWDLLNRGVIASFTGDSALKCCAVAADGVTIVVGEASGKVHFLRLEEGEK